MTEDIRKLLLKDSVIEKLPLEIRDLWPAVVAQLASNAISAELFLEWIDEPANDDLQAANRLQLLKIFEKDPDLLAQIESKVQQLGPYGASIVGDGAIAQGDGAKAVGSGGILVAGEIYVEQNIAINQMKRSFGSENVVVGNNNTVNITLPDFDPAQLRTAYLNYLLDSLSSLQLSGIDAKAAPHSYARLNLFAVYTPLMTTSATWSEKQDKADFKEHDDIQMREEELRLPALEQLNQNARLVLLGEPGSGKSTFVSFVAMCMAGEVLNHKTVNLTSFTSVIQKPEQKELTLESRREKIRTEGWIHGPLIPVRLTLRDFAASGLPPVGEKATASTLINFIADNLDKLALRGFERYLVRELRESGGIILLDGLDEVPEANQRRIQIKQAIEDFAASFPKCRILVTSRAYAYQRQDWRLSGFSESVLAPFSQSQIREFLQRWYSNIASSLGMNITDVQKRAEQLNHAIVGNEYLLSLAERPLLLTLMVSLHAWRGGTLPQKREELYADAVDLLLERWESPKSVRDARGNLMAIEPDLAEWLKVDPQKVRTLLEELAFKAHALQKDLSGTADIPEGDLVSGLMRISLNTDAHPSRLVDYLSLRTGLLIQRGVGIYTFPHRSFQEYLAACYLTNNDYPDKIASLVAEDKHRWGEIASLSAAKASRGTTSASWIMADALCYNDIDDGFSKTQTSYANALIAAQIIVENANLANISERNAPKLQRIRRWMIHILSSMDLPASDRVVAGNMLARLGDLRPEILDAKQTVSELVLIPNGQFMMGSDTSNSSSPIHSIVLPDYWLARYPVTNSQWQQFLLKTQYVPSNPLDSDTFPNHPVVGVNWYDAMNYCKWLSTILKDQIPDGHVFTLPSEAEWEKAARGTDGRIFPWGNDFDPGKANTLMTGIGTTTPVGCFPMGASPYGILEMSGNIMEWTRSSWGTDARKPDYNYPYRVDDGREDLSASEKILHVLRGGAFNTGHVFAESSYRVPYLPNLTLNTIGFRVACVPIIFK